nr:hypothetical protein CFP56_31668 [Quercus suber]
MVAILTRIPLRGTVLECDDMYCKCEGFREAVSYPAFHAAASPSECPLQLFDFDICLEPGRLGHHADRATSGRIKMSRSRVCIVESQCVLDVAFD